MVVPLAGITTGLGAFFWRRHSVRFSGTLVLAVFGLVLTAGSVMLALGRESDGAFAAPPLGAEETTTDSDSQGSPAADSAPSEGSAPSKPTAKGRSQESYQAWSALYEQVRRRQIGPALDSLENLMAIDPSAPQEKEVRNAVLELAVQAFYQRNEHSERMGKIMATGMTHYGPDLLFEIMVTRGATEADRQAQRILGDPGILARASEDTRLAYAIRTAKGCDEKKARVLLAKKGGGYRVLRELSILQRCRRRQPCCLADDDDVDAVKAAIEARR
jgi:hypothetical protein